ARLETLLSRVQSRASEPSTQDPLRSTALPINKIPAPGVVGVPLLTNTDVVIEEVIPESSNTVITKAPASETQASPPPLPAPPAPPIHMSPPVFVRSTAAADPASHPIMKARDGKLPGMPLILKHTLAESGADVKGTPNNTDHRNAIEVSDEESLEAMWVEEAPDSTKASDEPHVVAVPNTEGQRITLPFESGRLQTPFGPGGLPELVVVAPVPVPAESKPEPTSTAPAASKTAPTAVRSEIGTEPAISVVSGLERQKQISKPVPMPAPAPAAPVAAPIPAPVPAPVPIPMPLPKPIAPTVPKPVVQSPPKPAPKPIQVSGPAPISVSSPGPVSKPEPGDEPTELAIFAASQDTRLPAGEESEPPTKMSSDWPRSQDSSRVVVRIQDPKPGFSCGTVPDAVSESKDQDRDATTPEARTPVVVEIAGKVVELPDMAAADGVSAIVGALKTEAAKTFLSALDASLELGLGSGS
ncbi:MAG: hypothetical protein FWD57_01240, partial [Polyangiaceae bacterium]|nr:hypothetical protein [Polyangiaceae bacterium]